MVGFTSQRALAALLVLAPSRCRSLSRNLRSLRLRQRSTTRASSLCATEGSASDCLRVLLGALAGRKRLEALPDGLLHHAEGGLGYVGSELDRFLGHAHNLAHWGNSATLITVQADPLPAGKGRWALGVPAGPCGGGTRCEVRLSVLRPYKQ